MQISARVTIRTAAARAGAGAARRVGAVLQALAMLAGLLLAAAGPLRAEEIALRLSYLEDPGRALSVQDVAVQDVAVQDVAGRAFVPVDRYVARGFSRSAHWIRLEPVTSEGPLLLSVGLPNLDDVRLYTQDSAGGWTEARTGDALSYRARPVQSPFLGFVLTREQAAQPFFLRVVTSGTVAVVLDLRPQAEAELADQRLMLLHMAMFGLQLMAITVCFVLFLPVGDRILLWFGLSQSVWLLAAFTFSGYASVLFPARATDMAYSVIGTASFLIDMGFHLLVLRRFAPPPRLVRLAVWAVAAIWVAVPLLALVDVTLALQTRSVSSVLIVALVAGLVVTIRDGSLMPLWLIRTMYAIYLALVMSWLLPLLGLVEASWFASHAVILHGTVNFVLILIVVVYTALHEKRQMRMARARLMAAETDRAVRVKTIEAQSNLMAMMTHEVGTALSVIRYAVAQERVTERNARRIGTAISGLDQTMRSLNYADRIISGALGLRVASTDPVGILRRLLADRSDDRVVLTLAAGLEETRVNTDPDLIEIVLNHLLDNACKYAPPGGEIAVQVAPGAEGAGLVVTFRNALRDGPAPDLDRVCETYYRDPQVLDLPGTGMGLFIVKDVAQRLGVGFDLRLDGRAFVARLEIAAC